MRLHIDPAARREFREAFEYYEKQRAGLGSGDSQVAERNLGDRWPNQVGPDGDERIGRKTGGDGNAVHAGRLSRLFPGPSN